MVLLDINLGQENGLMLLEHPGLPEACRVILLSGITEQELIFRGFELRAFGFISKSVEPADLLAAIANMLPRAQLPEGGWMWDAQLHESVPAFDYFPRASVLTPKEREVFMYLRDGLLDKQIADRLGLSIHTVRVHLRAIKRKRGHNRRSEQQA
jgi:DNA-binding NarL/FixJ family response regulator